MSETTSQLRAYNVRRDGCRWQPQPSQQQGEGEAQAVRRLRRQQRDHDPHYSPGNKVGEIQYKSGSSKKLTSG